MSGPPQGELERRLRELGIVPGRRPEVETALESVRQAQRQEGDSSQVFVARLSNNSDGR
jgi:hypothetical protein